MAEAKLQIARPGAEQPLEARLLNQELSRLDYTGRILARAEDPNQPLLERVRSIAFFGEALDDFFQIRVAGLKEQLQAGLTGRSPDGLTPSDQLRAIRQRVLPLVERQDRLYSDELRPRLAQAGIAIVSADELDKDDKEHLENVFRSRIFPVLTPLAVDPAHPFPYISHRSLNLAVLVRDPMGRVPRFARVKVPALLPRFQPLPDGVRFVPLEQVIAAHLRRLFPGMEVVSHHPFRITRDADLELPDSEADDLLAAIQTELRRQSRAALAVRLEVEPGMSPDILQLLVRELELEAPDVYTVEGLLDVHDLMFFADSDRPELKPQRLPPATQMRLRPVEGSTDVIGTLASGDILVQHPYDSFATSVEAFIQEAAADPKVLAIKQTLYRTSGPASPIASALSEAAQTGKQVVALVELKARGDELANIDWAQALEKSGVHVVYGVVGLKTHAKITLVVRQEPNGIRRYVHVGTGNYNPATAQAYEDIGLLSADADLGSDVSELFNFLTGYSRPRRYRRLLVAPMGLRRPLLDLIRREAASEDGRIILKVNSLIDPEVVEALYRAAAGGVEVDLIVRSACSLRPGVPGLSESIRVRSLVGHFLEHSRVFRFGSDARGAEYYIGSADMMERNLDRRVEALVPVVDEALRHRLQEILDLDLADEAIAWQLGPDGTWSRVASGGGLDSQRRLQELAIERSRA